MGYLLPSSSGLMNTYVLTNNTYILELCAFSSFVLVYPSHVSNRPISKAEDGTARPKPVFLIWVLISVLLTTVSSQMLTLHPLSISAFLLHRVSTHFFMFSNWELVEAPDSTSQSVTKIMG